MPASIFNGTAVKILKDILRFKSGIDIISTTTNPLTTGYAAAIGSLLLKTDTYQLFKKIGAGNTAWLEFVDKTYADLIDAKWNYIQRYGFVDNTQTSISFDDTTYTFTLTDTGSGWVYMRNGVTCSITGNKTTTLTGTPPTKDTYYIYIDSTTGALENSTSVWTLDDTKVPVAIIIWDNSLTPKYHLADERHTCTIDRRMHKYLHNAIGTRFISGGDLAGVSVQPVGPVDTDNTFSVAQTIIADEDLFTTLAALTDGDGTTPTYEVFYRINATERNWVLSEVPLKYTPAGYIEYDNAGTMTEGTSSKYYNYYLLYTNLLGAGRYALIPGRSEFSTSAAAYAENPLLFDWTGFPIMEAVIAYQITFETSAAYGTKGKCRVNRTPQRINIPLASANVPTNSSHESLSGLQGGTTSEYFHLTSAQHTIATQAASTTLSGYLTSTNFNNLNSRAAGISLVWSNDSEDSCNEVTLFNQKCYEFPDGGTQKIASALKVPLNWTAGRQIFLRVKFFSPTGSDTALITAQSTLIGAGVALSDTTNQITTTNTALTITTANAEYEAILDITDNVGKINGVLVAAGDTILLTVYRGIGTNTDFVYIAPSTIEVIL